MNFVSVLGVLFCSVMVLFDASPSQAAGEAITIYVAPTGDDAADGSEPNIDPETGAGPVRTIERAKALARRALEQHRKSARTIVVALRGGRYELDQPLTFAPEDSGSRDAQVVYKSYPGELAHIDGSRRIEGWQQDSRGVWFAAYRDSSSPTGCPSQLFVNRERRGRPRLPAAGTFQIERVADQLVRGIQRNDQFYAKRLQLPDLIEVNGETEVVVFDAWTASRMRLKSYDQNSGLLRLSGRFAGHGVHPDMTPGLPYYIENFGRSPDQDGTWQCDAAAGVVRYKAKPNEDLSRSEVVAPRIGSLVIIRGRDGEKVHDIRFENLYFEMTSWHLPPDGWAAMQAEVGLPAAIELRDADNISLSTFALVHTGATGIGIRENCSEIAISGGELRDLGGSGIAVGSSQRRPTPGTAWAQGETSSKRTHHVELKDNLVASAGRIHWAAVGIWLGQADHVTVERNEVRDLYYTGISAGWTWNYGESLSHDNKIVGNFVHRYGQGVLSDLGGIYTLGRQTNSLVSDNIIVDGHARTYGGHGLYADAGTAGLTFRNNVVSNVSHAGIHMHYGMNLLFEHNLLFEYGEAGILCTRGSQGPISFKANVLLSSKAAPFVGVCNDSSYTFEHNLLRSAESRSYWFNKSASQPNIAMTPFSPRRDDLGSLDLSQGEREAVAQGLISAGRLTQILLTKALRDGPPAVP
ncbi:right-handed parallel beta-helix repeat-containing protein [Bradyrhizobium sp. 193]|uniref:right-handed parallel beta-helix repeat-containing protein n=1 Tax=Bradyrhizobium sp. 193 TaxID=2782661 RepID=UPI001FF93578|nr:right-handed parallel beta-helix repeat-containing protein [Bradyrhizobium sp. 193]MCK1485643.1 right-handed parallel beta-helix repeat-containing protein [Bradyrhizobium sp. 193]